MYSHTDVYASVLMLEKFLAAHRSYLYCKDANRLISEENILITYGR